MDVRSVRNDFPCLRNDDTVYLDSACQSLRPQSVIDSIVSYYSEFPACGGRSVHSMATRVSMAVDSSRESAARFFGCSDPSEFIFTKNCTEALNMVARGLALKRGDVVLTGDCEHNSNHVPWVDLAETVGIKRRIVRSDADGFDIEAFKKLMDKDVKIVSMGHSSNVTGAEVPVKEITEIAHDHGAKVMIDGAQAAPHIPVDLRRLDVDFYAVSVHKMLGPSGVGILYGKTDELMSLRPLISGGGTVGLATYDSVKLTPLPERLEAGLLNYSGVIGTGAALDYLTKIGMDNISKHERMLQRLVQTETEGMKRLSIVGSDDPDRRGGIFSFNIDGLESHDIAVILDTKRIMIRSGMHCAHPFFVSKGLRGCARASFYLYNDENDVRRFADALEKIEKTFTK